MVSALSTTWPSQAKVMPPVSSRGHCIDAPWKGRIGKGDPHLGSETAKVIVTAHDTPSAASFWSDVYTQKAFLTAQFYN
jgi:hypothetical protein